MSLIAREMTPDEILLHHELLGFPAGAPPDPYWTVAIVVQDGDGNVVGSWVAMNTIHLEGLRIHPLHQGKGVVPRRLMEGMTHALLGRNITSALTIAETPEIATLCEHAGFTRVPGALYQLKLPERTEVT